MSVIFVLFVQEQKVLRDLRMAFVYEQSIDLAEFYVRLSKFKEKLIRRQEKKYVFAVAPDWKVRSTLQDYRDRINMRQRMDIQ